MKINFDVKFVSGLVGSLKIQIIPLDLKRNNDCVDSIAIDEVAFSLVENLFNRIKKSFFIGELPLLVLKNLKIL